MRLLTPLALLGFCILIAVVVQHNNPDSHIRVIHHAYTIHHSLLPSAENILSAPVDPTGHPEPSSELVALDRLIRQAFKFGGDGPRDIDIEEQRGKIKEAAVFLESSEVPPQYVSKISIPNGEPSWWVNWPGVDTSAGSPVVLYLHGGGRMSGSAEYYTGFFFKLSRATGYRVLGADYRLGPEAPITAAVDDCIAAYRYLLDVDGVTPDNVFIAGESGGGLMTSLTIQAIRDRGLPQPSGAWIMSPQTDMLCESPSVSENAGRDAMLAADYCNVIKYTLGDIDVAPDHPSVSPLHASWADLPPLFFSVGESEILRDDTLRAVAKAKADGAQVIHEVLPYVPHAYPIIVGYAPELDAGFARGAGFIQLMISQKERPIF